MKKILLAISVLLFFIGSAQSREIEGEMICKVKSNYIVEINEGKPEVYSGIEGSFAKGDNLVFKFYTDNIPGFAQVKLLYKNKVLGSSQISQTKHSDNEINLIDDGFSYGSTGTGRYIRFSGNYITFNLYPFSGGREIRITRYYKGDWNGVVSGRFFPNKGGLGEKVATLDCRQSTDKVDDFIQHVRGLAKND
jgi:hypothetical protein